MKLKEELKSPKKRDIKKSYKKKSVRVGRVIEWSYGRNMGLVSLCIKGQVVLVGYGAANAEGKSSED